MMMVAGGDGALPPCPPCPPAGCPWGDDVVIPGRPLPSRRSPNATTGAFDPIVISGSINLQLFALSWQAEMDAEALLRIEAGRPGGIDQSSAPGLETEEWVALWAEKFKSWSESDRKSIGNSMVATGASVMKNPFTTSAGQFLTLLGGAIVKGDVDSAAFYCDQLERTALNQQSKDAVLSGLTTIKDIAKVYKNRFGK